MSESQLSGHSCYTSPMTFAMGIILMHDDVFRLLIRIISLFYLYLATLKDRLSCAFGSTF